LREWPDLFISVYVGEAGIDEISNINVARGGTGFRGQYPDGMLQGNDRTRESASGGEQRTLGPDFR
jgi:hypothetical protein